MNKLNLCLLFFSTFSLSNAHASQNAPPPYQPQQQEDVQKDGMPHSQAVHIYVQPTPPLSPPPPYVSPMEQPQASAQPAEQVARNLAAIHYAKHGTIWKRLRTATTGCDPVCLTLYSIGSLFTGCLTPIFSCDPCHYGRYIIRNNKPSFQKCIEKERFFLPYPTYPEDYDGNSLQSYYEKRDMNNRKDETGSL